jgi:DNA-binding response OmpR family regulator
MSDLRPTVLLVEDNPGISRLVEFKLTHENMNVVIAANGVDGLAKAKELMPDLILLDVMLPGIGGFEVLQAIRDDELTKDLKVIMLTSKNREEDLQRGFSLGVLEYISKPFKLGELMMRIHRALAR